MTVKELRDFLSGIDDDVDVYVDITDDECDTYKIASIFYEIDRKMLVFRLWL